MYINSNTYTELDDCYELKVLCNGNPLYTYFDKSLFDILNKYHWRSSQKRNKYYICTGHGKNGNKIKYMSNIILNFIPNGYQEVDHIDGDALNNRLNNLRIIDRLSNIQNVKVRIDNKTTGIRGISIDKRYNAYTIDFSYNGNRFYFKLFKTLPEAVYIRMLCELKFLGELRNKSDDEYKQSLINQLSINDKLELQSYFNSRLNNETKDV